MLRINLCADAGYYLGSVTERESALEWGGLLAQELGIGSLDHAALKPLLANRTPEGERLTTYDAKDRREGFDLTFSEPKSVSIMEQVAGDKRIGQARRDSVAEIMATLVEPRAATRRWNGKSNDLIPAGNLAYLAFDHLLARPEKGMPDPNGHTHVVVANAVSWQGKRTALEVRPIKEAAPFIEAAWHALFAEKLRGLGYGTRATRTAFEIEGVPDAMIRTFSTRTASVEDSIARRSLALDEQIRAATSPQELRLLEGRAVRLKSPKAKAAIGPMIREKKQPLLSQEAIDRNWVERLTGVEVDGLLTIRDQAMGRDPAESHNEPVLAPAVRLKATASLKDLMAPKTQPAPQKTIIEHLATDPTERAHVHLKAALDDILMTDSRMTEERLLTHALRLGVHEVTLPTLQAALDSDHFRDATKMVRAEGLVSTLPVLEAEAEVLNYAKAGKLHWVKNKVEGLPDAGKLSFPDMHRMVREAGDKHLVIAGDAKGQREGQPLRLLRDHAYMKPIVEIKHPTIRPPMAKPQMARLAAVKPVLKGWKERMKKFVLKAITLREADHVRPERATERDIER